MGEAARELEIKLVGAPADVAALLASPILAEFACGPASHERLVTTYFDTPYRSLARKGASLRLREEAAGTIQAVKLERRGEGALSRLEWERRFGARAAFPCATGEPAFADIDDMIAALGPVARVVSDRSTIDLVGKSARMEASVDLGRLEQLAGGEATRVAPLAEFEIELVAGKPRAIFRLARRLAAAADGRLQVSVVSKGARALQLADHRLPKETRPEAAEDASAADVFGAAFRQYTVRIAELRPFVADFRMPEAAHQMRVALRRLRVLARDYAGELRDDRVARAARRARDLARGLAPARDWDVFIAGALEDARARAGDGPGFALLAARAEQRRAQAWNSAAAICASRDFAIFILDLLEAGGLERWRKTARARLDRPAAGFAARALERRYEIALARGAAVADDDLDGRHRLRLAIKAQRYCAHAFRTRFAVAERRPFMSALSELQDALGRLSDAQAAARLAEHAAKGGGPEAARAAGVVAGLYASKAQDAAREADRLWSQFATLRPFWRDG